MLAMKPQNNCGCWRDQQRSGRDAMHDQDCDQDRLHRAERHAERQHRHEGAGGGGVVGGFRAGDAFHRALAEMLRMVREPLLDRIGHEGRQDVRGARDDADQEADDGAAPDRPDRGARLCRDGISSESRGFIGCIARVP